MLIAIDADDTLVKFNPQLLKFYNNLDGTNYTSLDIKSYDLEKLWHCTTDEASARIREFYRSQEFIDIIPVEGSIEAIDRLNEQHELIIVTSRASDLKESTERWIQRYFPKKFSGIYYTGEWSSINGRGGKKAHICKQKGVDVIVDDCLEYILACQKVGTRGLLFDLHGEYGWNKTEEEVERVLSWEEVVRKIN